MKKYELKQHYLIAVQQKYCQLMKLQYDHFVFYKNLQ